MFKSKFFLGGGKTSIKSGFVAFTLAEVLITLVIIGVVAAMTVPSLQLSTHRQEDVQRVKKTYSGLARAVMLSKFNNGPIEEWYEMADKQAPTYYELFFKPYFHSSHPCVDYKDCGYKTVTPWKSPNGNSYNWYLSNEQKSRVFFYLSDGTFIAVQTGSYPCAEYDDNGVCIRSELSYAKEPTIIFDINGTRKPNVIGRDVFFMQFNQEKGAVPYGYKNSVAQVNASCKKGGNGYYCLKKLMNDSWELTPENPM